MTGGARGIGLGIATAMARAGASVIICDLRHGEEALCDRLSGVEISGDISDPGDVARIFDEAIQAHGRIDILVNNAGVSGPPGGLRRLQLDQWQHVLDINLRGTLLMSRAAAQIMAANRAGRIINISSITGLVAFPGSHAYGVSKAGVEMLTRTMALELARLGITVNCIAPGMIEAPMLTLAAGDDARAMIEARIPMGRVGSPADIGNAAVFLASDAAAYITGATLPVDGGWTAFGGFGAAFAGHPERSKEE